MRIPRLVATGVRVAGWAECNVVVPLGERQTSITILRRVAAPILALRSRAVKRELRRRCIASAHELPGGGRRLNAVGILPNPPMITTFRRGTSGQLAKL